MASFVAHQLGRITTTVRVPSVDLCNTCGKRPKFSENGRKHPYCSRSCARNGVGPSPVACPRRGCRATGNPAFANFCSEVHAREAAHQREVEWCDLCQGQPRAVNKLCISCDRLVRMEPQLRQLNPNGETFKNLREKFLDEWESPQGLASPSFKKAYEILLPHDARIPYEQYRSVNRTFEQVPSFHSALCVCDLGTKGAVLCSHKSCGICQIIKSRFKSFAFSGLYNSGRFGNGIYTYRNPALADYFATSCLSSPYRVMIACSVLIEPLIPKVDQSTGEQSLFVPTADAILPVYVIMYSKRGKDRN